MSSNVTSAMDRLAVQVTSPDGRIKARLRGDHRAQVRFRPDSFDTYEAALLESQLSALMNTLWSGYRDAVRQTLTAGGASLVAGKDLWDANRRRYHTELDGQVIFGMSSRKHVGIRSVHKAEFEVRIRPRTLESITEDQFVSEFHAALMNWEADRRRKVSALTGRYFDDGRPKRPIIHSACESPYPLTGRNQR